VLEEILQRLGDLQPEAKHELQAARAKDQVRWIPNAGPQTLAYCSPADILLYGGQGGGGKSDLGLGLGFNCHRRSLIMRRRYTDLGAMTERAVQINGTRSGFNGSAPPKLRTADGRLLQFGANANPGDEEAWQGQPFDLKVFDEAVQFLESQVRFHLGWIRSTEDGQRTRAVLATNPPVDADGYWLIGMFRPWLDPTHANPAKPGELRWYVTDPDGNDMEVPGPEPIVLDGRTLIPQSRTFIPAALSDNPYLVKTGYQAQLDALPEPLRSAVRDGNFMAARQDAANQVIPAAWAIEAQRRWTARPPAGVPMCAIAADASGGGRDPLVLAPRHDGWFAPLIEVPGRDIPVETIGRFCAGIVVAHRRDGATVIVDMGGGYGGPMYEHLKDNSVEVIGYKGAEGSLARTADRQLGFFNKRSEALWRFREALDPAQEGGSPIALPPDPILMADLTAPTFTVPPRGIKAESKEDVCARLGRSTDRGDAVVMAWSAGLKTPNIAGGWKEYGRNRQPQRISRKPR
jgi:hypothetical protein